MCAFLQMRVLSVFSCIIISTTPRSAAEGCRDFTDTRGRIVSGTLIDFNATQKVVSIKREDGKILPAPLSAFCEADQVYVLDRCVENDFLAALDVSEKLEYFRVPDKNYGKYYNIDYITCSGYMVEFVNTSDHQLDNILIEYCIFYRQGKKTEGRKIWAEGVLHGHLCIETLEPASNQALETEKVIIYNEAQNRGSSYGLFGANGDPRSTGQLEGLWMRLETTLPSGKKICRNYCSPPGLPEYQDWKSETFAIGLNEPPKHQKVRIILAPSHPDI